MTVLYAVIPIILNAAIGFVAARRQIFDKTFFDAFSRLTFRYFIPCMLFASMAQADLAGLGEIRDYWLAYFVPAIIIFLLVRVWGSSTISLAVTYANTVLIGIPLVLSSFGEEGLGTTLTVISVNGLTLFTMVAITGPSSGGRSASLLKLIISTFQNPIIIGLLLGAAVNFLSIPIPQPLLESVSLAGRGALSCALFILGSSLATVNTESIARDRKAVALMCLLKLFIIPGLVFFAARQVLQLEPLAVSVLVTLAGCPSGINALPFAQHSVQETSVVSAAIFVSTVLSIVTLPAWVYAVGTF